ncbi:hypothetical protein HG530_005723 [Fusarium avenaceum]|nr:hypothetical protein HG530_005723 [Fusarium avenaceum]
MSYHVSHIRRKLVEVNTAKRLQPIESSKFLKPGVHMFVIFLLISDRAPLCVEDDDRRQFALQQGEDFGREKLGNSSLKYFPYFIILERRKQLGDVKVHAENIDTKVKSPSCSALIRHSCNDVQKVFKSFLIVQPKGLYSTRSLEFLWTFGSLNCVLNPHVTLGLVRHDVIVCDNTKVSWTTTTNGIEEVRMIVFVNVQDFSLVVDHANIGDMVTKKGRSCDRVGHNLRSGRDHRDTHRHTAL